MIKSQNSSASHTAFARRREYTQPDQLRQEVPGFRQQDIIGKQPPQLSRILPNVSKTRGCAALRKTPGTLVRWIALRLMCAREATEALIKGRTFNLMAISVNPRPLYRFLCFDRPTASMGCKPYSCVPYRLSRLTSPSSPTAPALHLTDFDDIMRTQAAV